MAHNERLEGNFAYRPRVTGGTASIVLTIAEAIKLPSKTALGKQSLAILSTDSLFEHPLVTEEL